MNKYKVLIEIFHSKNHVETKALTVEAGNKKLAVIRALSEISKMSEYTDKYKKVKSVEFAV